MKEETSNMEVIKKEVIGVPHPSEEVGYLIYCATEEELRDGCMDDLEDDLKECSEDGFIEDFDDDGFIEDVRANMVVAAQSGNQDVNSTMDNTDHGMVSAQELSAEEAPSLGERHLIQLEVDTIVVKTEPSLSRAELEDQFDASQRESLMTEYRSGQIPHHEVVLGGHYVTERSTMDSASSHGNREQVDKPEVRERRKDCEMTTSNRQIEQSFLSTTKSNLSKTIKNPHTGGKTYWCSVCDRTFTQSCSLTVHMRRHTGDKPYECSYCNRRFYSGSNLEVHLRTHTGERPYPCSVCDKAFAQWSNLSQHMTTHTGEKPYQCSICQKAFSQSGILNRHMKTHTDERPFQCSVCEKRFSLVCNLSRHMRLHTGEKPYKCTLCDKVYTHMSSLSVHTKIHAKANARRVEPK